MEINKSIICQSIKEIIIPRGVTAVYDTEPFLNNLILRTFSVKSYSLNSISFLEKESKGKNATTSNTFPG